MPAILTAVLAPILAIIMPAILAKLLLARLLLGGQFPLRLAQHACQFGQAFHGLRGVVAEEVLHLVEVARDDAAGGAVHLGHAANPDKVCHPSLNF